MFIQYTGKPGRPSLKANLLWAPLVQAKSTAYGNLYESNKYVYGLARTGDTVKLLIDPEKLIGQKDINMLGEISDKEQQ